MTSPADPAPHPWRRFLRFSVRGMIVVVLVIGATAMRRILIERARQKRRQIRGGARQRREVHPDIAAAPESDEDLLALDAALAKLGERDPVKARLVELRYFAGLTGEEAAEILGISARTADRYWVYARA
jgi:RNA polymerase sigma factor (TIGR02999 family)